LNSNAAFSKWMLFCVLFLEERMASYHTKATRAVPRSPLMGNLFSMEIRKR
jgi:hypothetical protein